MGKAMSRSRVHGSSRESGLGDIGERLEARMGKIPFSGRFHREPRKLEDDYMISKNMLGSGMTGDVRLATNLTKPGHKFAVKSLRLNESMLSFNNQQTIQQLKSEVENYLCIDHPHIARLYDVYEAKKEFHLVMECMEGGELFDRVVDRKGLPEDEASDALRQMLLALNYIHSQGIVHRDVKLENFMYDRQGSGHLKLIDFGFSKMVSSGEEISGSLGTVGYIAPEVLHQSYTSQCDVWSLGVCAFTMVSGRVPFGGDDAKILADTVKGNYTMTSEKWATVSAEAKDLVRSMLEVDPKKRITVQQALEHPFITRGCDMPISSSSYGHKMQPCCEALRHFSQTSKFRRLCLEMMAWSLSNEDRAKVRDAFLSLDRNQKGTITQHELKLVMVDSLHLVDDHELSKVFKALDYNLDNEIHYSDFLAAMVKTHIRVNDGLLMDTFRRLDTDASGFITAKNLQDVLGCDTECQEAEAFIAEADMSPKDGRLCFQEFAAYISEGNETSGAASDVCTLVGTGDSALPAEGRPDESSPVVKSPNL
jgi:calcium-dependent protein kinase